MTPFLWLASAETARWTMKLIRFRCRWKINRVHSEIKPKMSRCYCVTDTEFLLLSLTALVHNKMLEFLRLAMHLLAACVVGRRGK